MDLKNMFEGFFKDKTTLITGHTGFMGSWLAIWLNELNANVIGYALEPYTEKDNFEITNLDEKITSIIGDVRNYNKVLNIFNKYQPEIVFHLAAQPIVRKSYRNPKETFDINIGGTVNIFETFRKNDTSQVLLNITSDKCYENKENVEGYCEEDRLGGYDPYSCSKACSELVTSSYRKSYFNSDGLESKKIIATARSGNVIGGGDWQEDRLVPDCMRAFLKNEELFIRSPRAVRPWQHVLEPIYGYLKLIKGMWEEKHDFSGAWNFGSGKDFIFSVKELVDRIVNYLGKGTYKIEESSNNDNLHETQVLVLNCEKAKDLLNWETILDIDEMIKFTCDWYLEKNVNYQFNVKQIEQYIRKLEERGHYV